MTNYAPIATLAARASTDLGTHQTHIIRIPSVQKDDMEKVCSRPNSLPAMRQRVQPGVDNSFRSASSRQNVVREKLSRVASQLGRIHLRDLPRCTSSPDIKPSATPLEVIASSSPRYLSAPSARFSYDGIDLTGVIQKRLLEQQPAPTREKREHSSAIALKRHFRKMEERQTSRRRSESRCLSASFIQYSSDKTLYNRKSWRETRAKPWKEAVPKYSKPSISLPEHKKKAVSAAKSKLLEEAWLEERNEEMWAINAKEDFKPLTIVLVSSQLQHLTCAEVLLALRETEHSLPIVYDYLHDTHSDIIDAIKQTLDQHGSGLKMERLVVLCHGGPGHIYLLHKQVMTGAKIRKNKDIQWFWTEVGKLMSKRDNTRTTIFLGGSNFMNSLSGLELMSDITEAIKPNKASITALPMKRYLSPFEKDVVESIFVSLGAYLCLFKLIGPDVE